MNDDKVIKRNIKYLREINGLTQEELSAKLGYTTSNPVKDWERNRSIPVNMLEEIANFFQVSTELLKTENIEEWENTVLDIFDEKYMKLLFPLSENKEALKNDNYLKAYKIHIKLFEFDFDEETYETALECFRLYETAYKEGVKDAIINMMSISCLYKYISKSFNFKIASIIERELFDILDFKEKSSVRSLDKNERRKIFKKVSIYTSLDRLNEVEKFISDTTEVMFEILCELRNEEKYRDLADYYLGRIYCNNLIDTNYSKSQNSLFGQMYLEILYRFRNPYITKLSEIVEHLDK